MYNEISSGYQFIKIILYISQYNMCLIDGVVWYSMKGRHSMNGTLDAISRERFCGQLGLRENFNKLLAIKEKGSPSTE